MPIARRRSPRLCDPPTHTLGGARGRQAGASSPSQRAFSLCPGARRRGLAGGGRGGALLDTCAPLVSGDASKGLRYSATAISVPPKLTGAGRGYARRLWALGPEPGARPPHIDPRQPAVDADTVVVFRSGVARSPVYQIARDPLRVSRRHRWTSAFSAAAVIPCNFARVSSCDAVSR